jgi:hypothetical protein
MKCNRNLVSSFRYKNKEEYYLRIMFSVYTSRDSIVCIATGYGLDDQGVGVGVPVGEKIFTSPFRQDRLWSPPSFLSNGYGGLFPLG